MRHATNSYCGQVRSWESTRSLVFHLLEDLPFLMDDDGPYGLSLIVILCLYNDVIFFCESAARATSGGQSVVRVYLASLGEMELIPPFFSGGQSVVSVPCFCW